MEPPTHHLSHRGRKVILGSEKSLSLRTRPDTLTTVWRFDTVMSNMGKWNGRAAARGKKINSSLPYMLLRPW